MRSLSRTNQTHHVSFFRLLCAACVGTGALGTATQGTDAKAHGAEGDLMFYVDNGQLTVGRYDFDGGTGVVVEPVTEEIVLGEFEPSWEGSPNPGVDEPGMVTDGSSPADPDGTNFPFPANTALNINATLLPVLGTNAAYWDGTGSPMFGALPQDLILEDPFLNEFDLDGSATAPTTTLTPWQSDANGEAHDHIEFLSSATDAATGAGIYLLALDYSTSDSAVAGTTLYHLIGYGGTTYDDMVLEELLEEAEEYVESNIVPEPASAAALAVLGALGLTRRR